MSISIRCPNCTKTLKAKDELAGRSVKCPACQTVLAIPDAGTIPLSDPSPSDARSELAVDGRQTRINAANQALEESLLNSLDEDRFADAASILKGIDLWMLAPPDSDEMHPLIANLEELDALVVFTSQGFVQQFVSAEAEIDQSSEQFSAFAVSGQEVFAQLDGDLGVLVNPESDQALLLDGDCVRLIQNSFSNPDLARPTVEVPVPSQAEREANADPAAVTLRQKVLAELNQEGFYPAEWMPYADLNRDLRPQADIAGRLLALAGVFAWATAPPEAVSRDQLQTFLKRNKLGRWTTDSERKILSLSRDDAKTEFAAMVGWRLENMWPLAWVLGFQRQPDIGSSQIGQDVIHAMLFDFIGGFDATIESLTEAGSIRSSEEVNALEDAFYCAHNAVRGAQFGNSEHQVVPPGFDPIADGGIVHERRHSLTWCLSPGTPWDDTDLST